LAAAVLHVGAPERILQLSCGDGEATLFLAREFPSARIRGIDASADAVRHASARVGLDPEGRVAFKQGSPRKIPFPDDHFDLVAVIDSRPAAGEASRVLRPGGHLIIACTHSSSPAGRLSRWNLHRHGLELCQDEQSGNGSYLIARLEGDG